LGITGVPGGGGPLRGGPLPAPAAVVQLEGRAFAEEEARVLATKWLAPAVRPANGQAVRSPGKPAFEPPRSVPGSLDDGRRVRVLEHVEEHVDTEPSALAAGAPRVRRQLDLLEQPRVAGFPDLDRRKACRGLAVVDQARSSVPARVAALADRVRRPVRPRLTCAVPYAPPHDAVDIPAPAPPHPPPTPP